MTEEEKRDLNRRVALALGWNQVKAGYVDKWRGTIMGWTVESVDTGISPKAGGNAGMPEEVPDYCTDPAAADLMRVDIERRGWRWATGSDVLASFIENGMVYPMPHYANIWAEVPEWHRFGAAGESPYHALCLAFLAACEAEKATKAEEAPV